MLTKMSLNVAHMADLHLGRRTPGDTQGAERLNSLRRALDMIKSHSPSVLLLAGDTFDSPHVDRAVVQAAAKALDSASKADGEPLRIVVIPGNHDPSDSHALWQTFQEGLAPASVVRLVLEAEMVRLCENNLLIEAYPCTTRFSAEPPWAQRLAITENSDNSIRVVLAHGTLQGGPVPAGESNAYPFTEQDLERLGVDFIALGHFHSLYPTWDGIDETHLAYSYAGTHEPDQFGIDAGWAVLASVVKGQRAVLRRIRVGKRCWKLVEIAGPTDLSRVDSLRTEVENNPDPTRYVVRFRVGAKTRLSQGEAERLESAQAHLRALGAHVDQQGELQSLVNVDALDLHQLPSGAVKEALLSLQEEYTEARDGKRETIAAAIRIGWDNFSISG